MKESIIQLKSFQFSTKLVKLLLSIDPKLFNPLYKQLIRSGTSIGANIEEAYGGQSKNDFIAKAQIAYKENQETKYRIRLFIEVRLFEKEIGEDLLKDSEELSKIISKILITAKNKP